LILRFCLLSRKISSNNSELLTTVRSKSSSVLTGVARRDLIPFGVLKTSWPFLAPTIVKQLQERLLSTFIALSVSLFLTLFIARSLVITVSPYGVSVQ
jgi:hypothetical protein